MVLKDIIHEIVLRIQNTKIRIILQNKMTGVSLEVLGVRRLGDLDDFAWVRHGLSVSSDGALAGLTCD